MTRKFKTADYEQTLDLQNSLREALPPEHLVYFIVDIISQLDLRALYGRYGKLGAPPYAPEIMLGLLFYGYATGVFSSRKIERATYEVIPFRFTASNRHPDHATIAAFRKHFLAELKELFVQILLIAQAMNYLQVGNVSVDGSKMTQDSCRRLQEQGDELQTAPGYRSLIRVGNGSIHTNPHRQPKMLPPKRKWPTSSVPRLAMPSTACANPRWNRSLASSRRCWTSASSLFEVWPTLLASGLWSDWPTISNVCILCIRPDSCFNAPAYQKEGAVFTFYESLTCRYVYY